MKKYLLTSAAALAFCGLFTSCTHDFDNDGGSAAQNSVMKTYEQAFITAFGQPDPNQEWGFGTSTVAATRGGTRAVPGITFPDDFRDKTGVNKPSTIQKPTITESGADIVYTRSQTVQSIDGDKTIYVKSGVTLTIENPYDNVQLNRVNIYLASGSSLVINNNRDLYLNGNCNLVNDGGTIIVGDENNRKNFVLNSFTGTFWNNGTINVKEFSTGNSDGGKIYLGSGSNLNATNISLFKNFSFWNEGNITLTSEFNADQYGHKIYNSGTIITPKIILQKQTVLWNEGTITAANNKEITASSINNDDVNIYNGTNATLKLDALTLSNNGQLVVNDGILNVKGKITVPNNSEIVNYNKLTGGEFEMMSGGKFYNVAGGEVTIDGLSKIANDGSGDNKDNVWMNSGQYTTGSFEATGGCQNPAAFNNCHMTVTGKFYMNHSNFVLDGGAAVECASFEWKDDNYFHMGGKALLKVTGQLLANNDDTGYGFYGDDLTDYAVIKAGSIEKGSKGKFRAAYFGKLFIDTDSHFTQGENSADGTWYTFGDNVKFSFTDNTDVTGFQTHDAKTAQKAKNFSITIPRDNNGCTPGYKYGDDDPDPDAIRVICEDLSVTQASDWDFNDAVFDVKLVENNSKVQITLRAAGGTLLLNVAGREVHELFKEFNPNANPAITSTSMVSTGSTDVRGKYTNINLNAPVFTIDNNFGTTDVKEIAKAIPVQVFKLVNGVKDWFDIEWRKGEPSARIGVGTDYNWCDERTDIRDQFKATYSGNEFSTFKMYVRGILSDGWYNTTTVNQQQVNAYTGQ